MDPILITLFSVLIVGLILSLHGIALLFGALAQNSVALKKLQLLLSGILLVVAAILVISALALPKNLVLPILLVVVSVLLVLGILFTGGKKWDTGDNQKMGYKNYYQRKAEEEKKKDKEDE